MGSAGYIIVLLCLALWGAVAGWRSGLMSQIGSVLGVAFGIAGVRFLLPEFAPTVEGWLSHFPEVVCPEYPVASVGALIIYMGFYVLFVVCGIPLRKLLKPLAVKPMDSVGGMLFGFFKWLLMVSVWYNAVLGVTESGSLLELSHEGDGNPVELVMELSPAVFDTPSPDELHHRMQLIEARKISLREMLPAAEANKG